MKANSIFFLSLYLAKLHGLYGKLQRCTLTPELSRRIRVQFCAISVISSCTEQVYSRSQCIFMRRHFSSPWSFKRFYYGLKNPCKLYVYGCYSRVHAVRMKLERCKTSCVRKIVATHDSLRQISRRLGICRKSRP